LLRGAPQWWLAARRTKRLTALAERIHASGGRAEVVPVDVTERTDLGALRQESTDGLVRTTSISPGYVRTELIDSIGDPDIRLQA
jgi:NADP-dependent 3-hydroxy acid dehydrogenase YdfG